MQCRLARRLCALRSLRPTSAHRPCLPASAVCFPFRRQPSQAKELQGLANVQLTTVDVSSPPSIEKW